MIEIAAQRVPIPMFVAADMFGKAAEIMRLNFELCAFLQIVPVLAQ